MIRKLPVPALAMLVAGTAMADQPSQSDPKIDNPVVVTASPLASPLDDSVQSISVIDGAEIRTLPVTSLDELLALVVGIDVRRRGVGGVQADIGIRGTAYEQTLILLNGVPLKDPQTGHHDLNLPVPLEHIERIEIVRGPGGLAYGGNASGGLINIITRAPEMSGWGVDLRAGNFSTRRVAAHGALAAGRSSHLVSGSRLTTDGHLSDDRADADLKEFNYSGSAESGYGSLMWGAAAQEKEFGAWKFYTADFPDQREETATRLVWAGGDFDLGRWQLEPRIHWRKHEDWFRTLVGGTAFINEHETDVRGWRVNARTSLGGSAVALGASGARERIESNALNDHRRHEHSAWVALRQPLSQRTELELGLALADYSDHGSHWLPSAGLHHAFSPEWSGFTSIARSVRIPSYTERFLVTSGNRGEPGLQPERSDFLEVGLRRVTSRHRFGISIFERRTQGLIDWARPAGAVTWQADNFSGHRSRGSEIEWLATLPVAHGVGRFRLGWTWLDTALDDRDLEIKYALDNARHALSAAGMIDLANEFALSLSARYHDRRRNEDALLVAARVSKHFRRHEIFVEGENLLNRRVVESGFAPLPGRLLRIGFRANF